MKAPISGYLAAFAVMIGLAAPAAAQEGATLKRIVSTKTLTIAHREGAVPLSYVGSDGKAQGYSIDICMQIADAIKEEFKLDKLEIKYVPVTPQTRIPLIANGTADIECGVSTITLGRMKQVDFLNMTFITGSKLLVKKSSGIKSLDDLGGKVLAASLGTTNEKAAISEIEKKKLKVEVTKVKDHPQAMLTLEQGRADAYVSDDVVLFGMKSTAKNPDEWEVVGPYFSYDPYGMIIAKNDQDFRVFGNRVLGKMISDGSIKKLYEKWFTPGPTKINYPMNERLAAAFDLNALPE